MIGTSPLILLNDILPAGMQRFSFLELTPIGLALAIGGISYLSSVAMHMLAKRPTDCGKGRMVAAKRDESGILGAYPLIKGPFEISVPDDFKAGQRPQAVAAIRRRYLSDDCSHRPMMDAVGRP